ncbi:MAG: FtsX-like permease family protein [Chloroflexi bacterium]|nr:FtsX-like permease family protein [Chloroflexota bacterium]
MLRMAWSTFLDRWPVFIGAIITVAVGVALVQASLLTLISAVSSTIPPGLSEIEETAIRDGLTNAAGLLGMVVGISVLVAFFIVGSTFSFTVAQRARDFALLRLVGASPRQVGRLLLGEALLLGSLGTILGVLLGIPVIRFEVWMLTRMEFLPAGFSPDWHLWILAVSAGTGTVVAVIASLGASHRASRVRPLEALRDAGGADKAMSLSRWVIGLIALAGAGVLLVVTPTRVGDPLEVVIPGLIVLIIALSALTPLVVPLIGGLIGLVLGPLLRQSPIYELAHANLRDGVRRSASTAAPIVILVGLVVGFSGVVNVVNAGIQEETIRILDGDLIVTATKPVGEHLAALDGVRTVSEEVPLRVWIESADTEGDTVNGIAINPIAYLQTHRLSGIIGDLTGLQGETVALDQFFASGLHVQVGGMVDVRLDGATRDMQVIATFPHTLSRPKVLLPIALAPAGDHQRRYIIQTDETETAASVAEQITNTIPGRSAGSGPSNVSVSALDDWVLREIDIQGEVNLKITIAVLGLVTVYIVIAMINAVVISAAPRRADFAIARLTGLSRWQVVWMAFWESLTVVTIGVIVGALAAGGAIAGVTAAVSEIVGTRVMATPWALFGAVTVVAVVVVGLTSVLTTLAATRQPAVEVSGARE